MLVSVLGCASSSAGPGLQGAESGGRQCLVELGPRQGEPRRAADSAVRSAGVSRIIVHAQTPLAPLRQLLEKRIATRLAEGRVGIGPGGKVSYRAERGALALSVTRTALVIEAPVQAHAEACRGDDCYASCEPQALVRAEVPLLLGADYRFAPASVTLRFTRGCKVRALGGFLTIDVTPTIESQLQPELTKVARDIDRQLPDVKREVEKAWAEMVLPRPLPLLGCLVLQPSGIVQGPFTPSTERLQARFALLATPELRGACPETSAAVALPPLVSDPALPEEGEVQLGMVTALASLDRAFQTAPAFEASGKQLRVARAATSARGSDVDVELELTADVCGAVGLGASPDFSGDGKLIGLTTASLSDQDRERVEDADLNAIALARALAAAPKLQPILSVSGFRESAPTLAAALSQRGVAVSAKVSAAAAAGAAARGDELVAWLKARGSVALELTERGP